MGQFAALNLAADTEDDITLAMTTHVRLGNLDLVGDVDAVEARVIEHLVSQRVKREILGYRWADIKPRLTTVINLARTLGPINFNEARVDA
jgi:hypothetical protein